MQKPDYESIVDHVGSDSDLDRSNLKLHLNLHSTAKDVLANRYVGVSDVSGSGRRAGEHGKHDLSSLPDNTHSGCSSRPRSSYSPQPAFPGGAWVTRQRIDGFL